MKRFLSLKLTRAALMAACAAGSALAQAADFTIEVPLELSAIPPVLTQGKVRCVMLFDNNAEASDYVYSAPFTIHRGNYSGTARVEINTVRAANVAKYGCALWVGIPGEGGYIAFQDARTFTGATAVNPAARLMGWPDYPMTVSGPVRR